MPILLCFIKINILFYNKIQESKFQTFVTFNTISYIAIIVINNLKIRKIIIIRQVMNFIYRIF